MNFYLSAVFLVLSISNTVHAYPKSGPCAQIAAEAALKYAAESWNLSQHNQHISFSHFTPSSNKFFVQIYDVGILRQDSRLVQFDVGLDYADGNCENIEVRFSESVE